LDAKLRQKQEQKLPEWVGENGAPLVPEYLWNNKPLYAEYLRIQAALKKKRILWWNDSEAMLEAARLIRAGRNQEATAMIRGRWGDRQAAPEPKPEPSSGLTLEAFLADVVQCRATFRSRMNPKQTVCADSTGAYTWPDGDALGVARDYAQQVTQGQLVACSLLKHACARFLRDIEHAHERGYWADPWEARLVITWFRTFCKIDVLPWEVWLLVNLMSFKQPSGLRRFRECWAFVARKAGKTAVAAGLGLWFLICDQEDRAEIYSTATKFAQASISFKDARYYVRAHPDLLKYCGGKLFKDAITVEESSFSPLSCDLRGMDGLRPSCILADEVHQWNDRQQWDVLITGQVARMQPMIFAFTTPGEAQRGFCWERYGIICKILRGTIDDDRVLGAVWQLDDDMDYKNPDNWIAANPSMPITPTVESLQKQLSETEADPNALSNFYRYQCGKWVTFAETVSSLPLVKIDACRGYPQLPDASPLELRNEFIRLNVGAACYGGYDHGEVSDLACFVLLFPEAKLPDGTSSPHKVILPWFWMPEAYVKQREREWQMPTQQWIREGFVECCAGDLNDPRVIKRDIMEILQMKTPLEGFPVFNCVSIGYDKWHSRPFMSEIANDTYIECMEVPQQPSTLTELCVQFKEHVLLGNLWTLGNPLLRWMFSNVVLEREGKHNAIVPQKPNGNKHGKIDAVSAATSAWHRMLNAPPPSVYLTRGIQLI
jgi:phage terminase large subunit-like protein